MNNAVFFSHMQAAISGSAEAESLISSIIPSVCVCVSQTLVSPHFFLLGQLLNRSFFTISPHTLCPFAIMTYVKETIVMVLSHLNGKASAFSLLYIFVIKEKCH